MKSIMKIFLNISFLLNLEHGKRRVSDEKLWEIVSKAVEYAQSCRKRDDRNFLFYKIF